jgi:hypothetical protein
MYRLGILLFVSCVFPVAILIASDSDSTKTASDTPLETINKNDRFSLKFGMALQPRLTIINNTDEDNGVHAETMIRRLRFKLSGFAAHPSLRYFVQIAGSPRDIESTGSEDDFPGIIFDAYMKWAFAPKTSIYFGQMKLPANLSRLMSFTDLSFAERSEAERIFTPYRDIGFQLHNEFNIGDVYFREAVAITNGEGRNRNAARGGYCYTGRLQALPFGLFESNGDLNLSEFSYEETPKLAVGAAYSFNKDAVRQRSNLGTILPEPVDMSTFMADLIIKWHGLHLMAEYYSRDADKYFSGSGDNEEYIWAGSGMSAQTGITLVGGSGIAIRYCNLLPHDKITTGTGFDEEERYSAAFSYLFPANNIKLQTDAVLIQKSMDDENIARDLLFRFQIILML